MPEKVGYDPKDLKEMNRMFLLVLVSAGIFFLVAGIILWFGFRVRRMLTRQGCIGCFK